MKAKKNRYKKQVKENKKLKDKLSKIEPIEIDNGIGFRGSISLSKEEIEKRVYYLEEHLKEFNKLVIKTENELYIKELLNKAKDIAKYGADGKQHTRMFNQFEAKALLSYIEQLEQEKEKITKSRDFHLRFNKSLMNRVNEYQKENEKLQNNRDKANNLENK